MQVLGLWLWHLLPANPILVRVVQGGSRRGRHLLVRMGYLGSLIILVIVGLLTAGSLSGAQSLTELAKAGSQVFAIVSYGQVALICLLAPLFMAGAIAAEQSGQTFSILLTTPLSNMQIVLGSLFGRLFFVLALLISGLPLFAIVQIFGGVPIVSVFVSFGVAGLSALFVGSVAITLAVMRVGGRKAVFMFVIAVAAYLVGSYAADRMFRGVLSVGPGMTTWLTPLNPILVLEGSLNSADYMIPPVELVAGRPALLRFYLTRPLATFAILSALGSLVMIGWSSLFVRVVATRDSGAGWIPQALRRRLRLALPGQDRRRKSRTVWHNPIAWREASTRGNGATAIIARALFALMGVAAAAVALWLYHRSSVVGARYSLSASAFFNLLTTLLLVEVAVIVMIAIYMSAGSVSREREDGTLDLLLTTPITPRAYVWGKVRGLVSFLGMLLAVPIVTMAMVSMYTLYAGWQGLPTAKMTFGAAGMRSILEIAAPFWLALVLIPYAAFCVVVGMWASINSKGVLGAVIKTIWPLGLHLVPFAFCGWSAAENIQILGPAINGLSPATNLMMFLNPWERVAGYANDRMLGFSSVTFGALLAGAVYSAVVYLFITHMISKFDQTVRRLTGASAG